MWIFALWGGLIPSSIKDMKEMHDLGCIGFKGFMCFATDAYPRITDGYLVDGMRTAASFDGLIALHAENAEAADLDASIIPGSGVRTKPALMMPARGGQSMMRSRGRFCLQNDRCQIGDLPYTISQGAEFLRNAKKEGTRVYVETCPHYLILTGMVLRAKKINLLNVRLRSAAGRMLRRCGSM